MASLKLIAEGWYHYIKGDQRTRLLMKRRLEICDSCPNKVQTTGAGKVVATGLGNGAENLFSCDLCKCPLGALASIQRPACRGGYWDMI